jgi:diguanylate cyclase (GGDEF)-like protein
MFVAGCRHLANGARFTWRYLYAGVPALVIAVVLPQLSDDFNNLFMVQATLMAVLFAASFYVLRSALWRKDASPGSRVMSVALLLLSVDFLQYVPLFGARNGAWGMKIPHNILQYTSIVDLILEILLGFGTMVVLLEGVRREVEATNLELTKARDKLQLLAQMDPLTEALNRHAFQSLLSSNEGEPETEVSGCVAVIDVDNLKVINDSLGHHIGDRAIRGVASAVRSLIRADDMLFRWGGDEFMVLMFKLPEAEVERRMRSLNDILARTVVLPAAATLRVSVSLGVMGFHSMAQIGEAIEDADRKMYSSRQQARASRMELQLS